MAHFLRLAVTSLLTAAVPATSLAAPSCSSLSIKGFGEGDVVYFDSSSKSWKEVRNVARLARSSLRSMQFYYVAKGKPNQPGILVIKSARKPKPSADQQSGEVADQVKLQRKRTSRGTGNRGCVVEASSAISTRVPGNTYDGYHDYGYDGGEGLERIQRFHVRYLNRDRNCDKTDNPYGTGVWNRGSNRSQFSFDWNVVQGGMYFRTTRFIPGAYAATKDGLFDRVVVMEPYTIGEDKTACVPFSLKVRPDSILRIVDLEGRWVGKRLGESQR